MGSIVVARAKREDLPGVVDLCMLVEAQHETYNAVRWRRRPNIRQGYLNWMSTHLEEPDMLVLAAREEGPGGAGVVGALLAAIEAEIPIYTYRNYAFVHDLAVAEGYRRQGLARRMLEEAKTWANERGMNQLRLMVAVQNPEARALFEGFGFQHTYEEMILPL